MTQSVATTSVMRALFRRGWARRLAVLLLVLVAVAAGVWLVAPRRTIASEPVIHVRWIPGLEQSARTSLERRYTLASLGPKDDVTWLYALGDSSRANIRALITDPNVADTHYLDRARFTVSEGAPHRSDLVRATGSIPETPAEAPPPPADATVSAGDRATDVGPLIHLRTPGDVAALRGRLVQLLWGARALPTTMPASVQKGIVDERFAGVAGLERIDLLTVDMEFGLSSQIYHFVPAHPNNEVMLYHEGHGDDFSKGAEQIARFVADGYSVVALNMPLGGRSEHPRVFHERFGWIKLSTHEQFKLLSPPHGHPIKYFVEPVVVALNYLESRYDYRRVSMTGISGGGWTTTLAAAIDPRIARSFPVAGSYPLYLRSASKRDWGDWEQTAPALYNVATYPELYVLGSYGNGREQLQILNAYDPCCFAGNGWQTYRDAVRTQVQVLGSGAFDVYADDTHREHAISRAALSQILAEERR